MKRALVFRLICLISILALAFPVITARAEGEDPPDFEWVGSQLISPYTCEEVSLTVPEPIPFNEVRVGVNASTDGFFREEVRLISPEGNEVLLSSDQNVSGGLDILFDMKAQVPEWWWWIFLPPFYPSVPYYDTVWGPLESLANFTISQGEWILRVCNYDGSGGAGAVTDVYLNRFALFFDYVPLKPTELSFKWTENDPQSITFVPADPAGAWSVSADQGWLAVNPSSGVGRGEVTVSVDRSSLPDGVHNGVITVDMNDTTYTVPVTLEVVADYCGVQDDVSYGECQALLSLFDSTNGSEWNNKDNWLKFPPDVTDWANVTVMDGHIVNLDMTWNNLSGSLPAEIGNLTWLEGMLFYGSGISGELPATIANMTSLVNLWVGGNQLSGEIPAWLGGMTNLQGLGLQSNPFTGSIPPELGNLTNLKMLLLNHIGLTGEVPGELGNLANLEYFSVGGNQLSGPIPPELTRMTNLQNLYLYGNQFSGPIPGELGSLQNLVTLDMNSNQLSGEIPGELGNLQNLQTLNISWNQLSGPIPGALGKLANLQSLDLSWNQLSGGIPGALGKLQNLNTLMLNSNQLSGGIPAALGGMKNLGTLMLNDNQLSGPIPASFGNLTNLGFLQLANNQLSGSIPASFGNLTNLGHLELTNNQLSGRIPPELGNLTNLGMLSLSDNQLSGSIPPELFNATGIFMLFLDNNQLSGSIPEEIGNLGNLGLLGLSNNRLTGDIPLSITNLWLWDAPWLDNNSLHIPHDYAEGNPLYDWFANWWSEWHLHQVPAPGFTAAPVQGSAPLSVQFTDTSTGTYDTCTWNFGDGMTSTECSPLHVYTVKGNYNVTLTISGSNGESTLYKPGFIKVK